MNGYNHHEGADSGIFDDDRSRIVLLGIFFLLAFSVLSVRLYFLQLSRGEEHQRLITRQTERFVRLPGVRGRIFSADNVLLAGNRQAYDLVFFPAEMHQGSRKRTVAYMNNCAAVIAGVIGRAEFPDESDFSKHLIQNPGVPMTVFTDLSNEEIAKAFEASRQMSGVDIQLSPVRVYPKGDMAAHIIGYARKADPAKADDRRDFKYYYSDMEGKSGIEHAFDSLANNLLLLGLRAFPGRSIIQVNNIGYAHRELLGRREPVHGNDIILTIDSRAQKLAEGLLGDQVGAFVVVDADNGNIICAASSPRMDISQFTPKLDPTYYQQLLDHPGKPLINRAFQAIYPPGSTIKPLMCLAFLKSGIDPTEEIYCPGEITVGNRVIRCSAHRYAGADMNMLMALEKSCNTYMIHNAVNTGLTPMREMLINAGFGRKCGVKIPESTGDLPSNELKLKRQNAPWNVFDTALLSIGQGMISVTPLQMAMYCAAIANGGTLYTPQLVSRLVDHQGTVRLEQRPMVSARLNVSAEHLNIIREGMFNVVNSPGGSGRRGHVEELKIYGKTGTAEIGPAGNRRNITHFIAFTTFQGRTYALAVTIEDGLSGGRTCAPLAAAFFTHYLLD